MLTNTLIKETLKINFTKKTKTAITGEQLGAELFAQWVTAERIAYTEFYKYEKAKYDAAGTEEGVDLTMPMKALQGILDLVGEVNGFKIRKDREMLDLLSKLVVVEKEELVGNAWTLNDELKQAKKDLDNVTNGMNPDYIEGLKLKVAELEESLKIAKAQTGACDPKTKKVSENTFRKKFEKALFKTAIEKQEMKSWEQLQAEEQALKEERAAKAKARKQAKRQAKAQAENK